MATIASQPAAVARLRPDRIVMVARILGIDRDDRQMGQVLALPEVARRDLLGLVDRGGAELVAQTVLVDRDHREAARRERIAEHGIDPGGEARRLAARLGEDEVAGLGVLQVGDRRTRAARACRPGTGTAGRRPP